MQPYDVFLPAPMCPLGACFNGDTLTRLDFLPGVAETTANRDARATRLAHELDAYWEDPTYSFEIDIAPQGTPFQLRVWQALMQMDSLAMQPPAAWVARPLRSAAARPNRHPRGSGAKTIPA